jgi:hypothetical protein
MSRKRLAGLILLVAYFGAMPGLTPAAFAMLAKWEGSHGVDVAIDGGCTRVILTHHAPPGVACHDAIHRHGFGARLLTSFAQPPNDGALDHVMRFVSGVNTGAEKQLAAPEPPVIANVGLPEFLVVSEMALPPKSESGSAWGRTPAKAPPAFLIGLKITLLLI